MHHDSDRVTLFIAAAQLTDAGTYTLGARNIAGLAYSSCDVFIENRLSNEHREMAMDLEPIKPTVQLPLTDVQAVEGSGVQLDCEITGLPEPEVIWYHEGKPIKESADVQLLFRGDHCSLLIQEAFLEDMGEYKVVAINAAGEASSKCTLIVKPKDPLNITDPAKRITTAPSFNGNGNDAEDRRPRFEKLLTDILANEGETVEFQCSVAGAPTPKIKWFLSNNELFESDDIRFVHNVDDGKVKLVLTNITSESKGVYTVQATNTYGEAKCFSHLIVKSVNAADILPDKQNQSEEKNNFLVFKEQFGDKVVNIGDTVKFECIVIGKPTPKIRWMFDDKPVHGKNFLPSTSGERQVLTIPSASFETSGKISCVAENESANVSCVAYLNLSNGLAPMSSERTHQKTEEYNTESSNVTIKQQSEITTRTSQISSYQTDSDALTKEIPKSENFSRELTEFKKNISSQSKLASSTENIIFKSPKKSSAPRFILPLVGKIVDQGTNTALEAIIDGFPIPECLLTKNGEALIEKDNLKITNQNNRITIALSDIKTSDAGRYSISATNSMGNALSTADIVVKSK